MSEKMTASDALVRVLEAEGIEQVFGIPGGHILSFYDALHRFGGIGTILTKHEGGAAFMARMYARASGKPAVCAATAGPGATNLITGVADALVENVPMIVITGQVATGVFGKNADQEDTGYGGTPDQTAMFKEVTKASMQVIRPDQVVGMAREAFRIAMSPPYGPVHLCLPADVLAGPVDYEPASPESYRVTSWQRVDLEAIGRAARLIAASKRPALIAGQRCVFPNVSRELQALGEDCGIPIATTVVAKGIIAEDHPLSLGVLHTFGHRCADRYLKDADCVVAIGENFQENCCNFYDDELIPDNGMIQIDNCTEQVGRIYPLVLGVAGDIGATVKQLHTELTAAGYRADVSQAVLDDLKKSTEHFAGVQVSSDSSPLKPQRFFHELQQAMPEDSLLQVDIGQNFFWSLRGFASRQGQFYGTWGTQSMGVGAAGVIGLSVARPGVRTVCVCGDGSMQMNGAEVATAVNYGLPITWVVFVDGRLNMDYLLQGLMYGERYVDTTMESPDFSAWAEAFGARGYSVSSPSELRPTLGAALSGNGPAVVDLKVDPDEILPIKPRALLMAKKMGLDITDTPVTSRAFRKLLDEK